MKTHLTLTLCLAAAAQVASASEPLSTAQLETLIVDNTLYVTVPAGAPGAPEGGVAAIFYAKDGAASAQLPAGLKLVGTWQLSDAGYCVDWDNGPKNSCSTLVRAEDSFLIIDQATGDPRGQVFSIATGNPENL
ncbi:MAG: hypothetical protein AAFY06_09180 [Pseudomonadota bacterium]